MFDISEKLIVGQSDEIYRVTPINWEDSSWKHLSMVGGEKVISLSHAKVDVFSGSVLCLGKMSENPLSKIVWEHRWTWFKSSTEYVTFDTIDGEPTEFEWKVFQGFTTLQLCNKVHEFMSEMGCWWSFFSEYCIRSRIIFRNITTEYNSTFVFLVLCLQFSSL